MMKCEAFYKNGKNCRNKKLPGFDKCGIHGGVSMKNCCIMGDIELFKHILSNNGGKIRESEFLTACRYKNLEIVDCVVSSINDVPFFNRMRTALLEDGDKYYCSLAIIDGFNMSSLTKCLDELSVKNGDCHVCQENSCDVMVLPCCKNVMCKDCISKWNKNNTSCAFCRGKVY